MHGGSGDDRLWGQDGGDFLHGKSGNDVLRGGRGPDLLYGEAGNDTIFAWKDGASDTVTCSDGTDTVYYGDEDVVSADCEILINDTP